MLASTLRHLGPCLMAALLVGFVGCGDDGGDGDGDGSGGSGTGGGGVGTQSIGQGPCDGPEDCAGDVCVALIDGNNPPVYCTQTCGSCPDGFYCDNSTFGLVGLNFCRYGQDPAVTGVTPEPPKEPPRLPCKSDDECPGDAVCATYQGVRDCTILCNVESDCTPPALGGITMDLSECGADQTEGQSRTVCLPDPNCFPDPMNCISGMPF
jgi:hypothetical protein